MTPREAFEAWAPPHVPWSAWAKPTLLAGRAPQGAAPGAPAEPYPTSDALVWPRQVPKHCALILDMPGPRAVEAGVALVDRGYWPVPLFNATPGPMPLVDVAPTVRALMAAAPALLSSAQRADDRTLPCFLIDSGRCPRGLRPSPGRYDNRSIVFPQDFPSATLLKSRGIEQVMVVHHALDGPDIAPDLAHVLYGWQRDGLRVVRFTPASQQQPVAAAIARPGGFGVAFRRVLTFSGLRRSAAGGFGAFLPEASTGGGYA